MKIAIFTDIFYPSLGGVEDATADLAKALGQKGHEVTIFAPSGLSGKELDLGERVKIRRLLSIPCPGKIPGGRIIIPFGGGYRLLKKERPDIIHAQSIFGAGLEALLASRLLRVKLTGTNHSILAEFAAYLPVAKKLFSRIAGRYEAWFYNHCSFVSTASRAVFFALTQSGFRQPHQVVSNIVDVKNFQPAEIFPEDSKTIVYAGRFALEKRGEILLQTLSLVREKIPQVKLVLAGVGPEEENWKNITRKLNLEDNVEFVGKF